MADSRAVDVGAVQLVKAHQARIQVVNLLSICGCNVLQSHFINLNTVAKDAAKDARVEAKAARLLNGSGSLALVLQVRGSVTTTGSKCSTACRCCCMVKYPQRSLLSSQGCSPWPQ